MFETFLLLGIGLIFGYFFLYAFYIHNIKREQDFARDVYYYLIRRYPQTKIIDHGGLSSDPIIESHNAGPFQKIEIKVITIKEGGTDRDLIVRGIIDEEKHQKVNNEVSDVLVSTNFTWNDPKARVQVGISDIDSRFKISSHNQLFARNILGNTDLGNSLQRNFDLEAFSIHWYENESLAIQVRMESMNANSFLSAYNILLASINILKEKGYLAQASWSGELPSHISKQPTRHSHKAENKLEMSVPPKKSSEDYKYYTEAPKLPKIRLHPERDYNKLKAKQKVSSEKTTSEFIQKENLIGKKVEYYSKPDLPEDDSSFNEYKSLLASIRYQTEDIVYEKNFATIHTFSSQLPLIKVDFSQGDRVKLKGISTVVPRKPFFLEITNPNNPQSPNWQDPWKIISLKGSDDIINQLKYRTAVANRITELGNLDINIEGTTKEIIYSMQFTKSKDSLTKGYSLLIDIVWFLEMLI